MSGCHQSSTKQFHYHVLNCVTKFDFSQNNTRKYKFLTSFHFVLMITENTESLHTDKTHAKPIKQM